MSANIKADFNRCGISRVTFGALLRVFWISPNPGLKFMTIFRLVQRNRRRNRLLFYMFFLWWRHLKVKYGFDISYRTQIGKGLYIGHFGGIVIHGDAIIGENCNLSQGVTIGILNRGKNQGVPKIGNRVFMGPGAVILGGITIGDGALIGANAVVTFDVPDNGVVAAGASVLVSRSGSAGYIDNLA
jgi:serine O-acetyltransferase